MSNFNFLSHFNKFFKLCLWMLEEHYYLILTLQHFPKLRYKTLARKYTLSYIAQNYLSVTILKHFLQMADNYNCRILLPGMIPSYEFYTITIITVLTVNIRSLKDIHKFCKLISDENNHILNLKFLL